jgi:hypothetical protein
VFAPAGNQARILQTFAFLSSHSNDCTISALKTKHVFLYVFHYAFQTRRVFKFPKKIISLPTMAIKMLLSTSLPRVHSIVGKTYLFFVCKQFCLG